MINYLPVFCVSFFFCLFFCFLRYSQAIHINHIKRWWAGYLTFQLQCVCSYYFWMNFTEGWTGMLPITSLASFATSEKNNQFSKDLMLPALTSPDVSEKVLAELWCLTWPLMPIFRRMRFRTESLLSLQSAYLWINLAKKVRIWRHAP